MKKSCILLSILLLLLACVPTPEEEFIVNKGDQSVMIDMARSEDTVSVPKEAVDYRAAYGIPERLQATLSDAEGKVVIHIDAPVKVPDVPLPIVRVFAADFDQPTVTRIWNALLGDTEMYEWIDDADANRMERIKQDMEYLYTLLDDPEQRQASLYESEEEVLEELRDLQEQYRNTEDATPQEKRRVDSTMWRRGVGFADNPNATTQLGVWAIAEDGTTFSVNNSKDNVEPIYETTDGGWNVIDNNKQASLIYRRSSPSLRLITGERSLKVPFGQILSEDGPLPDCAKGSLSYAPKEAAERARAFLREVGLDGDFTVSQIELWDDAGVLMTRIGDETVPEPTCYIYAVNCVRIVADAPCCPRAFNVHESRGGESTRTAYAPSWAYEDMHIYLDADGIFSFGWGTPLSIADTLSANSKLKPFDEIRKIVEKRFPLSYTEEANRVTEVSNLPITELAVDRVELGLWRIAEQDKLGQGLLVPVYCFYGDLKNTWYQTGDPRMEFDDLLFVVNAVDGSVIDPNKGY